MSCLAKEKGFRRCLFLNLPIEQNLLLNYCVLNAIIFLLLKRIEFKTYFSTIIAGAHAIFITVVRFRDFLQ